MVIEVKRIGEIAGVEQLLRYQERLDLDATLAPTNGLFVATRIKPQARVRREPRRRVHRDRHRAPAGRRRPTSACFNWVALRSGRASRGRRRIPLGRRATGSTGSSRRGRAHTAALVQADLRTSACRAPSTPGFPGSRRSRFTVASSSWSARTTWLTSPQSRTCGRRWCHRSSRAPSPASGRYCAPRQPMVCGRTNRPCRREWRSRRPRTPRRGRRLRRAGSRPRWPSRARATTGWGMDCIVTMDLGAHRAAHGSPRRRRRPGHGSRGRGKTGPLAARITPRALLSPAARVPPSCHAAIRATARGARDVHRDRREALFGLHEHGVGASRAPPSPR